MELVILSTLATVAILIAELGDLARRPSVVRPPASAALARLTDPAAVAELATASRAGHEHSTAARPELDRAA